ncbi:MAG TPA: RagB/SusD family nutrient uptake outer membrane protein, partial [Chitinophagaceae bacterium]|nr:RagB/SusD family nutrient uptake outer membrane protein [Chitinophagaceae bacterium]
MKFKFIYKIFLICSFATIIEGCTKQLEVEPQQSIDASTALNNAGDVEAAIIGAYSVLAGGALYGTNLLLLADLQAAEGMATWRGTFQGQRQVSLHNMTRDNGEASRTWIAAYRAINMANIVLKYVDVVTDPGLKDQLEGEALFIRGIMHFELVRYFAKPWGATANNDHPGIVVKTTATLTEEPAVARSSVKAAYDQAIADLTAAASKLPDDNGERANTFVAHAFLARIYLQQGNYTAARDEANFVIEEGPYSMNDDILEAFLEDNSDEVIFEIEQDVQNNAGTANDGMATFYASLPGVGRADVRVDLNFVNSYDPNDLRKTAWYYKSVAPAARPGNWYTAKWNSFSMNLPIIRLAEMYLIRAECNLRLGASVGADPAEDLAQVRNPSRVGLPVIAAPTLADILQERIYELAFEGVRIHDVKRLKQTLVNPTTGATIAW